MFSSRLNGVILVGVVNLVFTTIALWLVDQAGRKTLILLGAGMQTVALATIAFLYAVERSGPGVLAGVMTFVAGHAIGNGAVCWVIISEIFPNKMRGPAMSIATTALWASAYLANQFFPLLVISLGRPETFTLFALMAGANIVFVWLFVPETKGYSLEQITRFWKVDST